MISGVVRQNSARHESRSRSNVTGLSARYSFQTQLEFWRGTAALSGTTAPYGDDCGELHGRRSGRLAQAMGFKRSEERMHKIEAKLRSGMTQNGFSPKTQEEIITHVI
jgi:hypothetical protein